MQWDKKRSSTSKIQQNKSTKWTKQTKQLIVRTFHVCQVVINTFCYSKDLIFCNSRCMMTEVHAMLCFVWT